MPTLAHFFGFPKGAEAKPADAAKDSQKKGAKEEDSPTPIKENKKRGAADDPASGTKRKRRLEAKGDAAPSEAKEGQASGSGKLVYNQEKEDAIRRQVEAMEEASEQEKADIDAVYFGMIEHMEKQPKPCSETSIRSYAQTTKGILKRDGRSFSAMGSKEYHALVKSMWENKKVHSLHAAAIKKFQDFYVDTVAENGGTFKLAPRWLEQAEASRKVDENGLKLRSSADAEQQGSRVVGIQKDDKGRWVASYGGKRLGAFPSEENAVQAILRAKRGLPVGAIGMKPLNWAKPKPATESQSPADAAGALSEQSAMPQGVDSSDITEVTRSVSIVDPVSLARIEIPVRGKGCRHVGVFDKATYIEFNEMKTKMCGRLSKLWNCPICGSIAKPDALVVIPAFVEVLATVQDMPDVDYIDVMPDGRLQLPANAGTAKASSGGCARGNDNDSDAKAPGASPSAPAVDIDCQ